MTTIIGNWSFDRILPGDERYHVRQRHRHCGSNEQSCGPIVPVCQEAHLIHFSLAAVNI